MSRGGSRRGPPTSTPSAIHDRPDERRAPRPRASRLESSASSRSQAFPTGSAARGALRLAPIARRRTIRSPFGLKRGPRRLRASGLTRRVAASQRPQTLELLLLRFVSFRRAHSSHRAARKTAGSTSQDERPGIRRERTGSEFDVHCEAAVRAHRGGPSMRGRPVREMNPHPLSELARRGRRGESGACPKDAKPGPRSIPPWSPWHGSGLKRQRETAATSRTTTASQPPDAHSRSADEHSTSRMNTSASR